MLARVLDRLPELFHRDILPLLGPTDRAMLGRVSRKCREAVPSWDDGALRVKDFVFCKDTELIAWAKANGCPWNLKAGPYTSPLSQLNLSLC